MGNFILYKQKMKFPIKDFFSKCDQTAVNGKFRFLWNVFPEQHVSCKLDLTL